MNPLFVFFLTFLSVLGVMAQKNYVPNGSFEKHRSKRGKLISNAIPWRNLSSVDYYREPLKNDTCRARGARTGKAYAGLRFQKHYREFLYVKLQKPLKKDVSYRYEAYFRLAYWSNVRLNSLGLHVSQRPYRKNGKIDTSNAIIEYRKKGLGEDPNWIRIGGTYLASGRERYLTIGNFSEKIKREFVKVNPFKFDLIKDEAYYFVDDVFLTEGVDTSDIKVEESIVYYEDTIFKKDVKFETGKPIWLDNVFFEPESDEFMFESLTQLDKFIMYLEDHPDLKIQVNGHVDATVRPANKIAKRRAEGICKYLLSKDVLNPLYYKGFGNKVPLSLQQTKSDTIEVEKNNRIEFVIMTD